MKDTYINTIGETVNSNWGKYVVGEEVYFSKEAFDNDSYEDFFDKKLIIDGFYPEDSGLVKKNLF